MDILMNEKELVNIKEQFSFDKMERGVKGLYGAEYYNKEMKEFESLLNFKLLELNEFKKISINVEAIKEGFKIIMKSKYHNRMNIGYQIILANNMERLFVDYLKWLEGLKKSDKFYDTYISDLNKFMNSRPEDKKKVEEYLDLSKSEKKEESKVIQLPASKEKEVEIVKGKKEAKMENNVIDISQSEVKPVEQEVSKDNKENNLNKEQVVNVFKDIKSDFEDVMSSVQEKFNKLKLKQWQLVAITGNVYKAIANTNSSIYKYVSQLLDLTFVGIEDKKDLIYDSLLALVNEDLLLADFITGIETQLSKKEYLVISGNIIRNFGKLKTVISNMIPDILVDALDGVVENDQKINIMEMIQELSGLNLLDINKFCDIVKTEIQKSSDTPEEDLKELQIIVEGDKKEAAMSMNPVQQPQELNVNRNMVSQQMTFPVIGEPSDLHDYEGNEGGFVVGGRLPKVIELSEEKDK